MSSSPETVRPGLRERKKAKTRAAIQQHAMRLFAEQGYHETTVDQIAEAAEISQSTFFRYFPTKEAVVRHDDYDPLLLAAWIGQPAELGPVAALRRAMGEVFGALSDEAIASERERMLLLLSVPELRTGVLEEFVGGMSMLTDSLAERTGRDAGDPAVRTLAGALLGVAWSAMVRVTEDPEIDFVAELDDALRRLEGGLEL
jgi:AcrR family transcriptional regulator